MPEGGQTPWNGTRAWIQKEFMLFESFWISDLVPRRGTYPE